MEVRVIQSFNKRPTFWVKMAFMSHDIRSTSTDQIVFTDPLDELHKSEVATTSCRMKASECILKSDTVNVECSESGVAGSERGCRIDKG